jgi:outer membrane lipoprotein SlyB
MKLLASFVAAALLLSGCARDLNSNTYTAGATSGKVLEGKIISMRPVTIKESARPGESGGLGGLAGAGAGAAAGNAFGSGSGNTGAIVGGVIAGAIAGALIEDAMSESEGMEYVVKLDKKHKRSAKSKTRKTVQHRTNDVEVDDDIEMSIDTESETDMVAVVQAADPQLSVGSKVLVIYSNDRPRLSPYVK